MALPPARPALAGPPQMPSVQLIEAWPEVEFKEPIYVTHAKDGSDMLYVVEQPGRIHRIKKYRGVGDVPRPSLFLDLRSQVYARSQGGLLCMACHPDFARNRLFYVSYLAENPTPGPQDRKFKLVIAEYRSAGAQADPASRRVVLEIAKKTAQHQAGGLAFGPDGNLYISVGDGNESKNDADEHAQNAASWLGKILCIDPGGRSGGKGYAIPQVNPWRNAGGGVLPEIWAFGLRNPWRFCWDERGRMWATEPGTTGPESREWVTQVVRGGNHGWPYLEGNRVLKPPPRSKKIVPRTFEMPRGAGGGSSAGVGGFVYRGDRCKALRGRYVFGDYMRGEAYALQLVDQGGGRIVGGEFLTIGNCPDIASFGEDEQGELYLCSNGDLGLVFTVAPNP
jgi:glucose/arabinose dehydrogenase